MLDKNKLIEFSDHDLKVIKEALFTQEKILSVQSRAGGNGAKTRLNDLQGLLQRMRRERGQKTGSRTGQRLSLWGQFTRRISC